MKDLKYLLAYTGPIAAVAGIYFGGIRSFGITYMAFGILPFLELLLPQSTENHPETAEQTRLERRFFDLLLYSHVPILYGILAYGFYTFKTADLTQFEIVGLVFNLGIMAGAFGINVGHELGHRQTVFEQNLAKWLLLPSLYQHFYVEHNRGHHKNCCD